MPNGHGPKKYGPHQYAEHGTSDCAFGCGCWAGDTRSGGPVGIDPFGTCPKNPEDGELRGGQLDFNEVVEQRISSLSSRLYHAEERLKLVTPSQSKLADQLAHAKRDLFEKNQLLVDIQEKISKALS